MGMAPNPMMAQMAMMNPMIRIRKFISSISIVLDHKVQPVSILLQKMMGGMVPGVNPLLARHPGSI